MYRRTSTEMVDRRREEEASERKDQISSILTCDLDGLLFPAMDVLDVEPPPLFLAPSSSLRRAFSSLNAAISTQASASLSAQQDSVSLHTQTREEGKSTHLRSESSWRELRHCSSSSTFASRPFIFLHSPS